MKQLRFQELKSGTRYDVFDSEGVFLGCLYYEKSGGEWRFAESRFPGTKFCNDNFNQINEKLLSLNNKGNVLFHVFTKDSLSVGVICDNGVTISIGAIRKTNKWHYFHDDAGCLLTSENMRQIADKIDYLNEVFK